MRWPSWAPLRSAVPTLALVVLAAAAAVCCGGCVRRVPSAAKHLEECRKLAPKGLEVGGWTVVVEVDDEATLICYFFPAAKAVAREGQVLAL